MNFVNLDEIEKEYIELVEKCAKEKLDKDIPNSTINHALVTMTYLFKNAQHNIKILTNSFYEKFWVKLFSEIIHFLKKDKNNIIEIIAYKDISKNVLFENLIHDYGNQIKGYRINTKSIKHTPNFMVIDPKGFRLELSDKDMQNSIVKGIINFGNSSITNKLVTYFNILKNKSKPIQIHN